MENIFRDIAEKIKGLSVRLSKLETWEPDSLKGAYSIDNVATPPTAAQLVTAFGDPATVGWSVGVLDDNGADTTVYLCVSNGTSWYYTALTKSV